jgi:CRISPR-associated endonuclease/helicase Cas3
MDDLLQAAFRLQFTELTGNASAFAWQEGLFAAFFHGSLPSRIDLPTGAGKTSVMAIWLLALAAQAEQGAASLPRRLVWVVDRRVVVDQATEEADRLANRLGSEGALAGVRQALAALCRAIAPDDSPLAVSTLRGEREDNREWSENPTRPAIVVGTVDMVGSRLLFSGYGDGRRRRALHAGLLGQDALIVNDEAHLTPAFAALLCQLSRQSGGPRPMYAMLLSATQRDGSDEMFPASLDQDLANEESEFAKRYRAVKRLHVLPPVDRAKDEIRSLALKPDRRTIVFVRRPEDARDLAAAVKKEHNLASVPLITGTQRGYERDTLPSDDTFKRFLSKGPPPADAPPCWLVATSAGEVGIDVSADRLITDLDTADHLLQRFGRLNRFGETEGDAYVLYSGKQLAGGREDAERLKATVAYLCSLDGSVSPEGLRKQPPPAEAISKAPSLAPLLPWLIDVWSLTSISAGDWGSRPVVGPWLHGDEEGSPPETYVAWRKDVGELADPRSGVPQSDLEKVFDCYPVLAHERLKQYTGALCDALKESMYADRLAILITADGEVHAGALELLLEGQDFRYATLILPPGVGYLDTNGMVDWSKSTDKLTAGEVDRYDVADNRKRQRIRTERDQPPNPGLRLRCTVEIIVDDGREENPRWLYFSGAMQKRNQLAPELLAGHQKRVAAVAADLGRRLGFDDRLVRVFEWSGNWHDRGKDRPIWQREAGNRDGGPALAKSLDASKFNGRRLGGYRHELGSLLDAETQLPADFTTEERDLALHLIAAHHGWARPHFPDRAYDKMACHRSERAALQSARRFGRLHQSYGAWRLAYLEAIFHSADAIASANTPELPPDA